MSMLLTNFRVLKNVEAYCAKLSKQGFLKRYITQSKSRKDKLSHLIIQFEAMRANLTVCCFLCDCRCEF